MVVEAAEGPAAPVAALVFYRSGVESFALLYHYEEGEAVSVEAPDPDKLRILVERLSGESGVEFLHPRLVAKGPGLAVWWRPAWPAPLYFTLPDLKDLSGEVFPQPPLLFVARGETLQVFALPENKRPGPDTPLLVAPYFNLIGWGGGVCLGSTRRGRDPEDWESAFFESAFSHLGGVRPLKEGSLVDLWRRLAGAERFPVEVLRETGRTLKEVLR